MDTKKTFVNFYWSVRRYVYESFVGVPIYYNPLTRPSVTADKTLMLYFQDDSLGRLTVSNPRIICVAKNDPETQKLSEMVSAVVEKFTSPASARRTIPFWDEQTKIPIGYIRVSNVRARPSIPYSEGFIQRAVDMSMDYVVEQRHLFT